MARIGFDIDGVCYDFRQAHSDFEVARGNTAYTVESVDPGWDYFLGWGMTLEQWLESYRDGVDAGELLRHGKPLPGAVEATRALAAAGHTIHFVTDRSIGSEPGVSMRYTAAWLADNGFVFHSLTISKDKTVVPTDVFIEDNLKNADALNAAGIRCYLINRSWNAPWDDGRLRVNSLDEFVAEVAARTTVSA